VKTLFEHLRNILRGDLAADEPMSRHTSWGVGGPAELWIAPADREDLARALVLLQQSGTPWQVVGSGCNLLVLDGGIPGAVICLQQLQGLTFGAEGRVNVEAGLPLGLLVRTCCDRGLAGLEELAGIPGSVGGALCMNAGAGNQEIGAAVERVTLLGGEGEQTWSHEQCGFAYRNSKLAGRLVVSAELKLDEGDASTLQQLYRERIDHRRSAHAVGGANAGSVFKNPPGHKAWELIDRAGMRGARCGGAQVAEKHANFIVTRPASRAADVLTLIEQVRSAVLEQSGVELETEVRIIGRQAGS